MGDGNFFCLSMGAPVAAAAAAPAPAGEVVALLDSPITELGLFLPLDRIASTSKEEVSAAAAYCA